MFDNYKYNGEKSEKGIVVSRHDWFIENVTFRQRESEPIDIREKRECAWSPRGWSGWDGVKNSRGKGQ